jgi:hypothetical protein
MSTSASLDTPVLEVEPGGTATATLTVHNTGQTVESYRLEVVGPDQAWLSVEPPSLSLYPGTSASATVRAAPPRESGAFAGERPFGVRVVPVDHPDQVVVPEAVLSVRPFADLGGELLPRTSSGASVGRHRLALDNRGNTAVPVRLTGQPADEGVRLSVRPEELLLRPGEAAFARVRVRARRRMWRGVAVPHPFQLTATAPGGETVQVDGGYQQLPLLPRWLPRAITAAVLALGLLAALWFAAVKPAVKSTAREVVAPEVSKQVTQQLPPRPEAPGGGGQSGPSPSAQPPSAPAKPSAPKSGAPGRRPAPAAPAVVRTPTSSRIEVRDAANGGTPTSNSLVVPARRVLEVTDLFIQNPQGDAGTLVITGQGGRVLFLYGLENIRDEPAHFVTPMQIGSGGALTVTVTCRVVGTPVGAPRPATCLESVLVVGSFRTVPASRAN